MALLDLLESDLSLRKLADAGDVAGIVAALNEPTIEQPDNTLRCPVLDVLVETKLLSQEAADACKQNSVQRLSIAQQQLGGDVTAEQVKEALSARALIPLCAEAQQRYAAALAAIAAGDVQSVDALKKVMGA